MTKILLIEPPVFGSKFGVMRQIASIGRFKSLVRYPPLDLMIIGGLLRKNNIDFKILDSINLGHTKEDIKRIIETEKPECVIFTTTATSEPYRSTWRPSLRRSTSWKSTPNSTSILTGTQRCRFSASYRTNTTEAMFQASIGGTEKQ
jgi:hypothetical protein